MEDGNRALIEQNLTLMAARGWFREGKRDGYFFLRLLKDGILQKCQQKSGREPLTSKSQVIILEVK